MYPIAPPLKPDDSGPQVRNLFAALTFLIDKEVFERLLPAELDRLKDQLRSEEPSGFYKGAAVTLVQMFQIQSGLGDALRGLVEDKTAELLNQQLKKHGGFDTGVDFVVRGTVKDSNGQPQSDLVVIAYDRDLRRWQELGRAQTNAQGRFEIPYRYECFRQAEGVVLPEVDLVLQVARRTESDALETIHVHEEPKPVPPVASVDVVVPAVTEAGLTEFERATALINPLLIGQGPRVVMATLPDAVRPRPFVVGPRPFDTGGLGAEGLLEGLPRYRDLPAAEILEKDVAFIVRETALEAEVVRAWAGGARLKADALHLLGEVADGRLRAALEEQGWWFAYAWQRIGWPGTLAGVLGSSVSLWEAALDGGAQRRWIPAIGPESTKQLLAALAHLRLLSGADPTHSADPMVPAMAPFTGNLPRETVATALNLYRERGQAALADFPGLAGNDAEAQAHLATLAQGIRVYGLVEGHAGLIEPLMNRLDGAGPGFERLADIGPEDWQGMAAKAMSDMAEAQGLAYRMQVRVEQQAPEAALVARMGQGLLPVADGAHVETAALLKDNLEVVGWLLSGGEVETGNAFIEKHGTLANSLLVVGQYRKLGVDFGTGWTLEKAGVKPGDLLTNFGNWNRPIGPQGPDGPLGPPINPAIVGVLRRIGDKFGRDLNDLLNPAGGGLVFTLDHDVFSAKEPNRKPPKLEVPKTLPGIGSPTVRGMFGDLDDCVCRPCDSVLGPGAYLVELIRALQRDVRFNPTGYELLMQRRPDILDLELSCENTDTLLPHIDLALEQLEWLVAQNAPPGVTGLFIVGPAFRPIEGTGGWLNPQPPAGPADRWRVAQLDTAVQALLQRTVNRPLAATFELRRDVAAPARPHWHLREGGGQVSWFLEPVLGGQGSNGPGVRGWRLLGMGHRRTAPDPDPRIEPAHRNPAAYVALADAAAVYPWTLPYSAADHERGAILSALKVDPLRLGPLDPADELPTAANRLSRLDRDTLGITEAEEAILIAPRTNDGIWNAWGFPDDNPVTTPNPATGAAQPIADPASGEALTSDDGRPSRLLRRASFLLARSGLTLEKLEAALGTGFVGGYRLSNPQQCKTSLMLAQKDPSAATPQGIDGAALDRLHRLVRLWRKLPAWSLPTLDSAIESMQSSSAASPWQLGSAELRLLAAIERTRQALGVPAEALLSLRQPLSTVRLPASAGATNLYRQVFLAPSLPLQARAAFENPGGANPAGWSNWFAPAAAAVQLQPSVVAAFGSLLGNALTVDSLSWLHRHALLARAIGRPVAEVLLLLQWMGWGAEGLGRAGDPLTATATLGQRRDDFERLAQIPEHSTAFAKTGVSLDALVAAQVPALQQRASTTAPPLPRGARSAAALRAMLLTLREKLAAVPEPPGPESLQRLRDRLAVEWRGLGWDNRLREELDKAFDSSPTNGIDDLSDELKQQLTESPTELDNRSPLLSPTELASLLDPSVKPEARFSFLLDRVAERRGEIEREVVGRLSPHLTNAQAVLRALGSAEEGVRLQAVQQIAYDAKPQRALGQVLPLFTQAEGLRFVRPEPLDSWRSRLDAIDERLAERERERLLLDEVRAWAGLNGAEWTDSIATAFLSDRLTIEPANANPTAPVWAQDRLLSATFYRSTSSNPPAELAAWSERLDTVLALQQHEVGVAALTDLPGLDWRLLISQANPVGRTYLVNLLWLADPLHLGLASLRAVLNPASPLDLIQAALAQRLGISPALITELARRAARLSGSAALFATTLRDPATLRRLFQLAQEARRLNASSDQIDALLGGNTVAAITAGRALLAAMLGPREWPKELRRLNDQSRRNRRDALVAYLAHRLPGTSDAGALFERMLIDPLIEPCLESSRLRQSTASVQMLIQRILEGLEPGATASGKLRSQWSWMRSYRLWEANRKVFLYPENWLLPELRDDKSPEFRALESRLSEDELTAERANQAFGLFLEDVNEVAHSQVLGMSESTPQPVDGQVSARDLMVVGRSPNPPYIYRWRMARDFGKRWMEWTPWERIDADIQTDHLVPFVAGGTLHLAWPVIEEQATTSLANSRKWKIELASTRFDGASWTKVKTSRTGEVKTSPSDDPSTVDQVPLEDRRSALAFRSAVPLGGQSPSVHAYVKSSAPGATLTVPPRPASLPKTPELPQRFIDLTARQELAGLIATVFDQLPVYCQDVIELYLHRHHANATDGYRLIPIGQLFTNHRHLAWHRTVRGDLSEAAVRSDVKNRTKDASYIANFLTLYHQQTFGTGYVNHYGIWTDDPYTGLVRDTLQHCSGLRITCLAWVKFPNGVMPMTPNSSHTFMLQSAALPSSQVVSLGVPTDILVKAGDTSESYATLSVTPRNSSPISSIRLTGNDGIQAVETGQLSEQTLHFVFDNDSARQLVPPPDEQQSFTRRILYHFAPNGLIEARAGDGAAAELPSHQGVELWMGGFREKATSLQGPSRGLSTPVAMQSPREIFSTSDPGKSYEIIPAGVPGQMALNQTGVWHFREGNGSCYIDAKPEPQASAASAQTVLFPNGWLNGRSIADGWYSTGRLPLPAEQRDDYALNVLPARGRDAASNKLVEIGAGRWVYDLRMPNAGYWWELCFHAPMMIADQLSRQHRFSEADHWLRMVFDPLTTSDDQQAFLRFRRFRDLPRGLTVAADLKALAKWTAESAAAANPSAAPPTVFRVRATIERWRNQPFRPFVIARQRHVAFLWRTLFAYLENLMAWADSLYRRETRESIQEALQLYIQIARLLGPRPRLTRGRSIRPAASFLAYKDAWDEFANAWLGAISPISPSGDNGARVIVEDDEPPIEGLLYFCIPPNDRILTYWDMVEDRLTNIRHCRNIDGAERILPLEAPTIDIDELIRSVAAGGTPEQFLAESFAQPWPYRYQTLLGQARDIVGEVKSLGSQLLTALEKRDSEQLALLRSTHELALLDRVTDLRRLQVEEAQSQIESLRTSREATAARYEQFQQLLGNEGLRAPGINETAGAESRLGRPSSGNNHADRNLGLITQEADQLEQLHFANWYTDADSVARLVAMALNLGASGFHVAAVVTDKPWKDIANALTALGSAASSTGDGFRAIAQTHQTKASRLAQTAANIRRRDEWAFQSNQALRELATADKQLLAAEARLAIARKELTNHEVQREQSAATDAYLREKFTSAALYQWQGSQLLALYRSTYSQALAMARRARRAAERELAVRQLPAIRDRWDAGRSGLLAGERLQQDLKALELAVLERHDREQELTKHVSLRLLDPRALVDLITNGRCTFDIPEWLLDLDAPGHFLRRIKTVRVSIPCVTGPYISVNARLSLLRSDTRLEPRPGSGYDQELDGDDRFETRFHTSESIFITSGREDAGMFETNLRDERYLPFEGAGVVSRWQLEFPSDIAQFDRATITDMVLHLQYTARDGGRALAVAARNALNDRFDAPTSSEPPGVMISLRTDFAANWAQATATNSAAVDIEVDPHAFLPYWMRAAGVSLAPDAVEAVALRRAVADGSIDAEAVTANLQNGILSLNPLSNWRELIDVVAFLPTRQ